MLKKIFTALLIVVLVIALVIGGIFLFGRYALGIRERNYDTYEDFKEEAMIKIFVDIPQNASDCKFYSNNIYIGKTSIYAFTLDENDYEEFLDGIIEEYQLEEEETEENVGTKSYRQWYLTKVKDANDPNYTLDNFPTYLKFEKVIDDDINDYDIILYSPQGPGSSSCGLVVNPESRRVVVYGNATAK